VNRLDRFIRDRRLREVARRLPKGARVLDVGCHDGTLFFQLGDDLAEGLGLDPALEQTVDSSRYQLRPGRFPADAPPEPSAFDVVTMVAVFEHLTAEEQRAAAREAFRLLRPRGLVVMTVPSPTVDRLLDGLIRLRLLHGMDPEAHHGFDPVAVIPMFVDAGFRLSRHRRFELGFNNLFVFERPGPDAAPVAGGSAGLAGGSSGPPTTV
jgi:2-polyprenyl-3-methyl-5-hydroxy-6-metoxy-1,4-benzoquinol methylase